MESSYLIQNTESISIYAEVVDIKPKALAVISGKGGSGKTSITVELARYMASKGKKVAVIDLDIKGPNLISRFTDRVPPLKIKNNRMVAYRYSENISVFSAEMYADSDTGIALHSDDIKRFIRSVFVVTDWGFEPELYICDTDPAASDSLEVLKSLFGKRIYGVLVSTPDRLSVDNTVRSVDVCRDKQIPLIGYIGNMAYFRCPVCNTKHEIFGNISNFNVFDSKFGLKELGMVEFTQNLQSSVNLRSAFDRICRRMKL